MLTNVFVRVLDFLIWNECHYELLAGGWLGWYASSHTFGWAEGVKGTSSSVFYMCVPRFKLLNSNHAPRQQNVRQPFMDGPVKESEGFPRSYYSGHYQS